MRDQILYPWQVAEFWYVVYDPNAGELSPEEEERIRADIAADRLGEDGGWEEPENNFVYEDEDQTDEDDLWDDWEDDDWSDEEEFTDEEDLEPESDPVEEE